MLVTEVLVIGFGRVDVGSGGLPVCPGCGDAPPLRMRPAAEVLADVRRVVEGWPGPPGPNVWLAGGEAFAHPGLPGLVSDALNQGVERLRLTTAGPALSQGMNAPGVIDAGVRHIEVVVVNPTDGSRAGGGLPAFDSVLDGLKAFVEAARSRHARVAPVARVMTCSHTYAATPATVAALAAAGAVVVTVEFSGGISAGTLLGDEAWFDAVVDSGVVNKAWVQFDALPADDVLRAPLPFPGVAARGARAWDEIGAQA